MQDIQSIYRRNTIENRVCLNPLSNEFYEKCKPLKRMGKKFQFDFPTQQIHVATRTVRTRAEDQIWSSVIYPLHFPQLLEPKRFFLVYGGDASGKSSLVRSIYKGIENCQETCSTSFHFVTNAQTWAKDYVKPYWDLTVQFLQICFRELPEAFILLEVEHFDHVCENWPSAKSELFDSLLPFRNILVACTTKRPQLCKEPFAPLLPHLALTVFVDYPDKLAIEDLLMLFFWNTFHIPNQHEVTPRLSKWCREKAAMLEQKKVSMSDLTNFILPRITYLVSTMRLYVRSDTCGVLILPSDSCKNRDMRGEMSRETRGEMSREMRGEKGEAKWQEILEKTEPLSWEDIQILNPGVSCEDLKKPCMGSTQTTALEVEWLVSKWDMISKLASRVCDNFVPAEREPMEKA